MKPLKAVFGIASGVFVLPIVLAFTRANADKLHWLDSIYGNTEDGLRGDPRWYPKWAIAQGGFIAKFPRFWWLAVRNPAHNLLRSLGANGEVTLLHRSGQVGERGGYHATAIVGGQDVSFAYGVYKYPFINRYLRFAFGAKIWPQINEGDIIHKNYGLSFQPFTTAKNAGISKGN